MAKFNQHKSKQSEAAACGLASAFETKSLLKRCGVLDSVDKFSSSTRLPACRQAGKIYT